MVTPLSFAEDVQISIAGGRVFDIALNGNDASNTLTVSSNLSELTMGVIGKATEASVSVLLQNRSNASRRLGRLSGGASSGGSLSAFGVKVKGKELPFDAKVGEKEASFAYSLSRSKSAAKAGKDGGLEYSMNVSQLLDSADVPYRKSSDVGSMLLSANSGAQEDWTDFVDLSNLYASKKNSNSIRSVSGYGHDSMLEEGLDIWAEASYNRYNLEEGHGDFAVVYLGADYLFGGGILAGVEGQVDWNQYDDGLNSSTKNLGFMVGPYVTAKLLDELYVEAQGSWGQGFNSVNSIGVSEDDYESTRWRVSGAVIGNFEFSDVTVNPEVRVSYYEEETDSFVNSFGNSVPSVKYTTGQVDFGPRISQTTDYGRGSHLRTNFSLSGVWTFEDSNTGVQDAGSEVGLTGRVGGRV